MFGYTKPIALDLTIRENNNYTAHYCGLCGSLSRNYGMMWRMATNYESTLLMLLISGQLEADPQYQKEFCFLRAKRCLILKRSTFTAKTGAALTVILGTLKLRDSARDGVRGSSLVSRLLNGSEAKAVSYLKEQKFNLEFLNQLDVKQEQIETSYIQSNEPLNFDEIAGLSGDGLGLVFAHTGKMTNNLVNVSYLQRLGCAIGRVIYTIDCLEDLDRDLKHGNFNGLVASGMIEDQKLAHSSKKALEYMWRRTADEINTCLIHIEVYRFGRILENIICEGLASRFINAMNKVETNGDRPRLT